VTAQDPDGYCVDAANAVTEKAGLYNMSIANNIQIANNANPISSQLINFLQTSARSTSFFYLQN